MWRAIGTQVRTPVQASLAGRLCLTEVSKDAVLDISIAFTIYHNLKLQNLQLAVEACASRDFTRVAQVVKSVAGVQARAVDRV